MHVCFVLTTMLLVLILKCTHEIVNEYARDRESAEISRSTTQGKRDVVEGVRFRSSIYTEENMGLWSDALARQTSTPGVTHCL